MASARLDCPHAVNCPGCPLFRLDYANQLEIKRTRLVRSLTAYAELRQVATLQTVAADPVRAYRRRAKLVVDQDRVGLYSRTGHRVLDVPQCRILEPAIAEAVAALRTALPASVPLRAVDLRNTDDGILVTFVVDEGVPLEVSKVEIERLSDSLPGIAGVAVSHRPRKSVQLLGRDLTVLSGPSRVRRRISSNVYAYETHGAFAQAHRAQEDALERDAAALLAEKLGSLRNKRLLELFSGTGGLSLKLASLGADVTAVEAFAPAADLARLAAEEQNLRVDVHPVDAAALVRSKVAQGTHFDAVIANPPRRGLSPELRAGIAALSPAVVVYVSCRPETLARDAADFARKGLCAVSFVPYDLMPWTAQVETLAVLAPAPPPSLQVIYADERLVAAVKAPHEPTTPQGEQGLSLLDRVRVDLRLPNAVPVHRLDIGTSGVCLFATNPEHVPGLSGALAAGIKEYVALARGITRSKGIINRPLSSRGRSRVVRTRYKRTSVIGGHSLLRVQPDQGRKHQIRLHLASIGHPILGDARYGDPASNEHFAMRHGLDRTFLHNERIILPYCGTDLDLVAPLAPDLAAVLDSLERNEPSGDGP